MLLLLQIHPNPQFDAEAGAQELRDSMKGLGNKRHLFVICGLIMSHDMLLYPDACAATQSVARGKGILPRFLFFFPLSSLTSTFTPLHVHAFPFPIPDTAAMPKVIVLKSVFEARIYF